MTFNFVYLNERTLVRFLWSVALRRNTGVLEICPWIPPLKPVFRWLVNKLRSRDHVFDVHQDRPDLVEMGSYAHFLRSHEHFPSVEPWLEDEFKFHWAEERLGHYAQAFRHAACNYINHRPFFLHTLRNVLKVYPDSHVFGLPKIDGRLYEYLFKIKPGNRVAVHGQANWLFNGILTLLLVLWSCGWVLLRLRLNSGGQILVFMGFDFSQDIPREKILWDELSDAPLPNIIFFRNRYQERTYKEKLRDYRLSYIGSGVITVAGVLPALATYFSDMWVIVRHCINRPPSFYWNFVKMPYRRLMYRALFNRYRCQYFWGKDDYNTEHLVRSMELRRIGARHFGRLHGLPAYPVRSAQSAYIDFDYFCVFGSGYHTYFVNSWPSHMNVLPLGCYGMSRTRIQELRYPRPADIVVNLSDSFQNLAVVEFAKSLAQAFPGCIVYLKPRPGYLEALKVWLHSCGSDVPSNLEIFEKSAEEAIFAGKYWFCDPSTLVLEGAQWGNYSFVLVLDNRWRGLLFEKYPNICIRTIEQAVNRIRALEDNTWPYPYAEISDLVNLTGENIWDRIRAELSLPQIGNLVEPHLKFLE